MSSAESTARPATHSSAQRLARVLITTTLFILAVSACFAQQPTLHDEFLDHLAGRWVLQGTIAGKKTTHDVDAQWVMQHQYLRIHEVSRELNPQGEPAYEATVYVGWNQAISQYGCVWLDTYGGLLPVSLANAKRNGNEIPFLFRDEHRVFHTTFRYHPDAGTWDWDMDSETTGKLTPFARLILTPAH